MAIQVDPPVASPPATLTSQLPNAVATLPTFTKPPTATLVGDAIVIDFAYGISAWDLPTLSKVQHGFSQIVGTTFTVSRDPEGRHAGLSLTVDGLADVLVSPGAYLWVQSPAAVKGWWASIKAFLNGAPPWLSYPLTGWANSGVGSLSAVTSVRVQVWDEVGRVIDEVNVSTARKDFHSATPTADCDLWSEGPAQLTLPTTGGHHKRLDLEPGTYTLQIRVLHATEVSAQAPDTAYAPMAPAVRAALTLLSRSGGFVAQRAPADTTGTVDFSGTPPGAAGARQIRVTVGPWLP